MRSLRFKGLVLALGVGALGTVASAAQYKFQGLGILPAYYASRR